MQTKPDTYRETYVQAVTRGEAWAPGQEQVCNTAAEREHRQAMEDRKTRLLAGRVEVPHPAMLDDAQVERALRNIRQASWAAAWFKEWKTMADHVCSRPDDWLERMTPELTPTRMLGFSCPRCVGTQSGEGFGAFRWDYRTPEVIQCDVCGQTLPDAAFPETRTLVCPRRGQTFTFYESEAERTHPKDHSGRYAWQWVGKPAAISFSGLVRERKIRFLFQASLDVARVYRLTGEARYAAWVVRALRMLATRYPGWLYHDMYGTFADTDPLYAAAHDTRLPLDFKRHPHAMAYGGTRYETGPVDDTPAQARMLATYFGASRVGLPDTSALATHLACACRAYDLVHDARDPDGRPLWTEAARRSVERDLILEFALEPESWLGGAGRGDNTNNKSPEVYHGLSTVAKCLGIPEYAHVALSGLEKIRGQRFLDDGTSRECALYTDKYLSDLLEITECLHGFEWPADFAGRAGRVDVYATDAKFRRMVRSAYDSLRPDGTWFALSDTYAENTCRKHVFEIAARRYPEFPAGLLPLAYANGADWATSFSYRGWLALPKDGRTRGGPPTPYALFNLDADALESQAPYDPPEVFYPGWMNAILRHGRGPSATALALVCNPPGIHRHHDLLSLYYETRGRGVVGDLGYMADSPFLNWYYSSFCHNLVIVDDACQTDNRRPAFRWMAISPSVSAVEAEARAYAQCPEYRRTVVMIKGPGTDAFVVDIFRVKGGKKHVYRMFSELAASDSHDGRLSFTGLAMPPLRPFPTIGGSIAPEHVYGLLDTQRAANPPTAWQACWEDPGHRFRLHLFTPTDAVETAHGPGQERITVPAQLGRRVRYVDGIREGEDLESVFVAIHEPDGADGRWPILCAERLPVASSGGPDAVALRIESLWGTYLVLSDFAEPTDIGGVRFQGALGVLRCGTGMGAADFTVGAGTLLRGSAGFTEQPAWWEGAATTSAENRIETSTRRPAGWPPDQPHVQVYAAVEDEFTTGFPIEAAEEQGIRVRYFPLGQVRRFRVPAVRVG